VAELLDGEQRVLPAVRSAADAIAAGAELIAERYDAGGRLLFAGAGTSGRIAWAQAAELPGTFGLPPERVQARIAGGTGSVDADEDDLDAAASDVADLNPSAADVLVAVAASGRTPYTLHLAEAARGAGAAVVAVVTVPDSPLGALADVAIEAVVGPEVLRGSTRMGAGTAQKIALDALTTAAAVRLGRVHDDHMVDVVGANAKLRERVAGIVADIAGGGLDAARAALADCEGDARAAVLVLVHGLEPADARTLAAGHRTLRDALESVPAKP
jgi:N-acetylmuramic acid 6-phosphate etherase